ncbi:hypothetical protein GND95_05040 [Defluviitalea raffinosedens]|uniref:Cell envelope-related transcriptional attenuator domain-containing protein n=1 Tax=Defluviitalea raffinosedens TaxID=1450156 RepID=A0A7C8HF71_9FIRM|nr:hypothetical protein GND95_05040 [Defluviitalea raffinosedens]
MRGKNVEDTNNSLKSHNNIKKIVTIIIGIIVVLGSFLLFIRTSDSKGQELESDENIIDSDKIKQEIVKEDKNKDKKNHEPQNITGLIIGLDESKVLTDVVMVVHFDPTSKEIRLISIPRDFYVDFEDPRFSSIKENNPNIKVNYSKLTEVYNRIKDKDKAVKAIKEIAEQIVGFPLDYYVKIDLDGFKAVIDLVGGVEVELPNGDTQILDSEKAEEFVRNRYGHADGDFGRIRMQQLVIKSLTKKIMEMRNPVEISKVVREGYKNIETDFSLLDGMKYIQYLLDVKSEDIFQNKNMVTIPTKGEKIDGIWYEMQDKEKTKEILDKLFEL